MNEYDNVVAKARNNPVEKKPIQKNKRTEEFAPRSVPSRGAPSTAETNSQKKGRRGANDHVPVEIASGNERIQVKPNVQNQLPQFERFGGAVPF